jgi:hypothetical protein
MADDGVRALGALVVASGLAVAAVQAAPYLRRAENEAVMPVEMVYTIINLTEDYDVLARCPLELDDAKAQAEAGMSSRSVTPVYSPIADGPGVLVHEVTANLASDAEDCLWTSQARYGGGTTPTVSDRPDRPYSSLDRASRAIALD